MSRETIKQKLSKILPSSRYTANQQIIHLNERIDKLEAQIKNMEKLLLYQIDESSYPQILKQWYKDRTGKILNLANPETYNEKIQWLKLYDKDPRKTLLSDKYLVRDWIKEKIGEDYLIPLLGVYRKASEIDFDALPDAFVLKANHGSGMNVIIKDKKAADLNAIRNQMDAWLRTNFAFQQGFEMQYNDIPRRIIAEEYITGKDGDLPDYKFWCFDGKCEYIEFIKGRGKQTEMAIYDRQWKKLPFTTGAYPALQEKIDKPKKLQEMVEISEKLSRDFKHVRVDLYLLNDQEIRFGEMTFSSSSGTASWSPEWMDFEVGKKLKL